MPQFADDCLRHDSGRCARRNSFAGAGRIYIRCADRDRLLLRGCVERPAVERPAVEHHAAECLAAVIVEDALVAMQCFATTHDFYWQTHSKPRAENDRMHFRQGKPMRRGTLFRGCFNLFPGVRYVRAKLHIR